MLTHEDIINSIKRVCDKSTHVHINKDKIKEAHVYFQGFQKEWLPNDKLGINNFKVEDKIKYLIICESLNFCFWDTPIKWKIEYQNVWYSGSYALFFSITKALQNGYDLLNPEYLEKIDINTIDEIFKGTTSIPMLEERLSILKELANEFKTFNYEDFLNVHSDIELLNKIITNFSNFKDISIYKGDKVYFFKRAMLLVGDLLSNVEEIKNNILNNDNMLACADYKIPQVLRHLGILEYSEDLKELIDNKKEVIHDSEEEIEIRAGMLYAIELIKKELEDKNIHLNSSEIDNSLWLLSKNPDFKEHPHHLTRTIYY